LISKADGAAGNVTQNVQVDFEDLTTYYVNLNLNENFYLKAGIAKVDVITNETLGTGSTYGNADLDGTVFGAGYNKNFDNGLFVRAEGTYQEFDGVTINGSGDTSVTADEIKWSIWLNYLLENHSNKIIEFFINFKSPSI
jgi:hypothetical protein